MIYFGDSKRMPYGNREDEEIVFLANQMIAYLEKYRCKSDTARVQIRFLLCMSNWKAMYRFFSIVDAGARAVTQTDNNGTVGVIATCSTINSGIYEKTIATYDPKR